MNNMVAQMPKDEEERIAALHGYDILDSLSEDAYNAICKISSELCGTPMAAISFVDRNRQWFKARVGIEVSETARDISFCSHTILQTEIFVIPDATLDARFKQNPLVANDPHIRFYAGCPLVVPGGHVIGSLCVIDTEARKLTESQQSGLLSLSHMIIAQLEMKRVVTEAASSMERLNKSERLLRSIVDATDDWIFVKDEDFRYVLANKSYLKALKFNLDDVIGHDDLKLGFPREQIFGDPAKDIRGFRSDDIQVLAGEPLEASAEPVTVDGVVRRFNTKKCH